MVDQVFCDGGAAAGEIDSARNFISGHLEIFTFTDRLDSFSDCAKHVAKHVVIQCFKIMLQNMLQCFKIM